MRLRHWCESPQPESGSVSWTNFLSNDNNNIGRIIFVNARVCSISVCVRVVLFTYTSTTLMRYVARTRCRHTRARESHKTYSILDEIENKIYSAYRRLKPQWKSVCVCVYVYTYIWLPSRYVPAAGVAKHTIIITRCTLVYDKSLLFLSFFPSSSSSSSLYFCDIRLGRLARVVRSVHGPAPAHNNNWRRYCAPGTVTSPLLSPPQPPPSQPSSFNIFRHVRH